MNLNLERLDLLIAHYVSGSLPEPAHVLVGAHLEMQPAASRFAHVLEDLAGDALYRNEADPLAARERRLNAILASLPPREPPATQHNAATHLPKPLHAYVGRDLPDIPWKMKLPGLRQHVIEKTSDVETALLWARPGRALPNHGHHGLELTLVLEGQFDDHRGSFGEGDVSVADETLDHRPVAGNNQPCVCFSVLFAPIALSGSTIRLFGDILGM